MSKKIKILIAFLFVLGLLSAGLLYFKPFEGKNSPSSHYTSGVKHPKTGALMACNTISLVAKPETDKTTIETYANHLNATIGRTIPQIHAFQINLPGKCDAESILNGVDYLKGMPGIKSAEPDYLRTLDLPPTQ